MPNPHYGQQQGQPYQTSQDILAQILAMRKQQGAQPVDSVQMPQMPQGQGGVPAPQGNPNSGMEDLAALSKLFGYEPNTMFGADLGGSGAGSAPIIPGGGSALGLFGTSQGQGQAGGTMNGLDRLWSAIMAMI